jgi:hypothetical protein
MKMEITSWIIQVVLVVEDVPDLMPDINIDEIADSEMQCLTRLEVDELLGYSCMQTPHVGRSWSLTMLNTYNIIYLNHK